MFFILLWIANIYCQAVNPETDVWLDLNGNDRKVIQNWILVSDPVHVSDIKLGMQSVAVHIISNLIT
jgi:hypothetical protein